MSETQPDPPHGEARGSDADGAGDAASRSARAERRDTARAGADAEADTGADADREADTGGRSEVVTPGEGTPEAEAAKEAATVEPAAATDGGASAGSGREAAEPGAATFASEVDAQGNLRIRLGGRLDADTSGPVWARLQRAVRHARADVHVDAGELRYVDSTGVGLLLDLQCRQRRRSRELHLERFPEDFQPLLDMYPVEDYLCKPQPGPKPVSLPEQIGRATARIAADVRVLVTFVGHILVAFLHAARYPRRVRWGDTFRIAQTAGVNALPVAALIGFLIGLVFGYQSASTLRNYGAESFLARLIGLSMVRELGPLMTAVVLAARSGSAFAAEIGTMKVNEEVDALGTMGLEPVRFLVVPRVLAAVFMTPLLSAFASAAGVVGGALVSVYSLDSPLQVYTSQLVQALSVSDVLGGLAKAFVFGILVAAVGCIRGLQTQGGPTAVGEFTTSAVVSGIVLIALADSVFSVVYYQLGI